MRTPSFSATDDGFHFNEMSDRWWETETCWFSFHVPERNLTGWIYILTRPNVGSVAGGAWIWDHTASLPWEVLYNTNFTVLRLPKARDLTDIRFPTGASVKVLEPLKRYRVGFHEEERVSIDLEFDAVMPPMPLKSTNSAFLSLNHFDQIGRVSGEVVLKGEKIQVDCLAMRDRSWGPRPEHRPKASAYVTAMASKDHGLLVVTDPLAKNDPATHGFLLRDGRPVHVAKAQRSVERDPVHNWTKRIRIEGVDEEGREFTAVGESMSRMIINRHTFIDSCSFIRWNLDGETAWGEDQDMWPIHRWADHQRSKLGI